MMRLNRFSAPLLGLALTLIALRAQAQTLPTELVGKLCVGPYKATVKDGHQISGAVAYAVETRGKQLMLHRYRQAAITLAAVSRLRSMEKFQDLGVAAIELGPFTFDNQRWDWRAASESPPLVTYGRIEGDHLITGTDSREFQQVIGIPVLATTTCDSPELVFNHLPVER